MQKAARGADVTFLGEVSTEVLWREYAECKALLFAADEDFGMVPLEAQACGRPVVAYGQGGSLETVRGGDQELGAKQATGVYFEHQTVESLMDGIRRFEAAESAGAFRPDVIRGWAAGFRTELFLRNFREFILSVVPEAEAAMAR